MPPSKREPGLIPVPGRDFTPLRREPMLADEGPLKNVPCGTQAVQDFGASREWWERPAAPADPRFTAPKPGAPVERRESDEYGVMPTPHRKK